jgi:hypothetical protein
MEHFLLGAAPIELLVGTACVSLKRGGSGKDVSIAAAFPSA